MVIHGTNVVIGARYDADLGANSGSAYVFSETSPGKWAQVAKLLASDGAVDDYVRLFYSYNDVSCVVCLLYIRAMWSLLSHP